MITQTATDGPVLKLDDWQFTTINGLKRVSGRITNISDMLLEHVYINFLAYNESGYRIESPFTEISFLCGGETWKFDNVMRLPIETADVKFLRMSYLPEPD